MHVVAGKAVCLGEALDPSFQNYAKQIVANAQALAETLTAAGFRLASGGTDNHLMLLDVGSRGIGGKLAESALGRAGMTVNKNMIPFDKRKPMDPSGIRLGTPALTTRGMREDALRQVGRWIVDALATPDDEPKLAKIRAAIHEFVKNYPVPSDQA
jgi:glycine hydroxymethyltransferase